MKLRVVFDTNVVLSALVFHGRIAAALRDTWSERCVPLGSTQTVAELQQVLRYRKFRISESDVVELLGDYLPHLSIVQAPTECPVRCRDPRDQKFLDLAHCADADLLVSGGKDLLDLTGQTRFAILTPAEFLAR